MHKYKIGDKVPLADGDHVIEGLKGSLVRIRNVHTGNMQILHPSALSRLLDVPPIFNADEPAPRDLALLDDDERERVETLARHMREVIEGSGDIRYNPDKTNLTGRVNAKVDELSASEQRVSVRSLFRQIAMYKEYGAAGLVDGRKKREIGRASCRERAICVGGCAATERKESKSEDARQAVRFKTY